MVDQYKAVTREIEFEADAKKLKRTPYECSSWPASSNVRCTERRTAPGSRGSSTTARQGEETRARLDCDLRENLKTTTTTPKDRQSKSKYNTYRYKDCPRANFGARRRRRSRRRRTPRRAKWLYFVTVNLDTGETKFAEKQADFEKIRLEFQSWCQSHPGRCES